MSGLSREEIVAAAIRTVHGKGFHSLTMRQLAEELGVTPAAMYYHIRGKAEIARLVIDAVLEPIELPGPDVGDWDERIRRLATQFWGILNEYPGIASMLVLNEGLPALQHLINYFIDALQEAGFTREEARRAAAPINSFAIGELFGLGLLLEPRVRGRRSPVSRSHARHRQRAEFEGELDPRKRFLYGIDILLAGIRAQLDMQSRSRDRRRQANAAIAGDGTRASNLRGSRATASKHAR